MIVSLPRLSFAVALAASLLVWSCKNKGEEKAAPAPLIPLKDFFKDPERSSYELSPDGAYVSFLAPYKNRPNLFVQKVGEKEAKRITSEEERGIDNYFWASSNRLVFLQDEGGNENYFLVAIDKDGGNEKALTRLPGVRTIIINSLYDNDREMIIGLNKRNPAVFDAYRIDVETGELKMIAQNPGNIQDWKVDHDGKLRLAMAVVDGADNVLLYRKTEQQPFKPVFSVKFGEDFTPLGFTFDNKNIYAKSNVGRDKAALVIFDPEQAKEVEILYANDRYDVEGIYTSRKEKKLICANYTSWKTELQWFDKETEKMFNSVKAKLGENELTPTSTNRNEDFYLFAVSSDRLPGKYYLYNKNTDSLSYIADTHPWIKEENMARMTPIQYNSRDGLTIDGYLTLPVGQTRETARMLPVVAMPHGGPWARDEWGYDPWVQFLANRGYAVLQMNFRGSTGYGREFENISAKQWGMTMQDDVTDGVRWLTREGIADSTRIAIFGASYGGYATLAGLAFTPDLYACGVDIVGVSNLFTFMRTIPPYWRTLLDYIYKMVGDPSIPEDSIQMVATSPVFHAEKITAPLLIAQGANDPRVAKAESDQMVEALRKRGVEVEYIMKENEGHGFQNEENLIELFQRIERFLAKHLGGRMEENAASASDSSKH